MKKIDPIIDNFKPYKKEINKILAAIKRYDRIAIFRHIMPDFDALGSQFGLYTWIKDNFPNKEVKVFGDNHVSFTPRLFPETDKENESWFEKPFLGIILDTANKSRIADPRWKKAKFKIKIDHHPEIEHFGNVQFVNTKSSAAAENIVAALLNMKGNFIFSKEAATYFYIGLVGDSGRFQYSSTSQVSFAVAAYLAGLGINISEISQNMYLKQINDLYVSKYILNNFVITKKGIGYYVLDGKTQDELNITTERGKDNVNIFSNIEGIDIWCSITEDLVDKCWRVSIRSKKVAINGVAAKFEGGGHAQASGAKLKSLDDLPTLIEELENLL